MVRVGQLDEAGVADEALVGELGDLDGGPQVGFDPGCATQVLARGRRLERAVLGAQRLQAGAEDLERPLREPGADAAGEHEDVAVEAPDEQRAERR